MDNGMVVVAGGSGFIGRSVVTRLAETYEVTVLTRRRDAATTGASTLVWDGRTTGDWAGALEGATAVINLVGRSVDCRHTAANREQILRSRVDAAAALGSAAGACAKPPAVWIQTSALGYYGDRREPADESAGPGAGFMADVCCRWEAAYTEALPTATRGVCLRLGVVLGRDGGALPRLAALTRWFLGGTAGAGDQMLSWLHIGDLTQLIGRAVAEPSCSGVYNAAAPEPVSNRDLMRELRRVCHRPWSPPAPAVAVKVGAWLMGTDPGLALESTTGNPARLQQAGFRWQFSDLRAALEDLLEE